MVKLLPAPENLLCLRPYLRVSSGVSKDATGHEASPNQQQSNLESDGKREGFTLHPDPYRDIGSASRFAKKDRQDFDRLIADLQAGRLEADGLALWESSRGSRRVSEWVLMLDLLAEQHLKVWVHTHRRMYDPRVARDRRTLLEDAVDAEYESGKTSERLRRDVAARAAEGRAAGRLSYGYTRKHDAKTGALLGRVPEEPQAKYIRELFARFVSGDSLNKIEKDWAKRGITNRSGQPFKGLQLREMLRNRVYIAERVHIPGRETRWWKCRDEAIITAGTWPPILKGPKGRKLFFAAQAILDDPSRVTTRPGGARHLLTMFTRCDKCDGPMTRSTRKGRETYRCNTEGCCMVYKDELDAFAVEVILTYLSSPEVYDSLSRADEAGGTELEAAQAELEEQRQEHRQAVASFKARRISLVAFEATEPDMLRRIDELSERVRQLETPPVLRGLIEPGADVRTRWEKITDPAIRRQIAQVVLTPQRAGQLRVMPSPIQGHHPKVESRVALRRA